MQQFLIILILLAVTQALNQLTKSSHEIITISHSQDLSIRRLFPRADRKRPVPDPSPPRSRDDNKRQRQASGPRPSASDQARNTRQPVLQSGSGEKADRNQQMSVSPGQSQDRRHAGIDGAKSSSPLSSNPSQKSQSRQGTGSLASPGRRQSARTGSDRAHQVNPTQALSSGRSQGRTGSENGGGGHRERIASVGARGDSWDRTPSARSEGRQSNRSQHSSNSVSTPSEFSEEFSSAASSPRRANPVSVSTLTKGPATVEMWAGRTRGEGLSATHIPEGRWRMTDGSNPRIALIATKHHGDGAETYAFGTGRRAGIRTNILQRENPNNARITIPRLDGSPETYRDYGNRRTTTLHPGFGEGRIAASFKGKGEMAIEAKNPGPHSDSDLEF